MKPTVAVTIVLGVLCVGQLRAENWSCWRGPNCNGQTSDENIPVRWSDTENVCWKTPVAGVGHSSPIVWENAVFLTYCHLETQTRRLLRIDANSGEVVWDREIAVSPIEEMHRDNTPASATPATDGRYVYVAFLVDGGLEVTAVDYAGETQWSRRVGSFVSAHGFCTSLVLDASLIFLSGLQDGAEAFVAALDKDSGEIVWKVPRSKQIRSFSTPYLCKIHGRPAILLSGAEQTVAYDRLLGKTIWEIEGPGSKTVSSLVVSQECDLAFVCGGRDQQFYAIDMDSDGNLADEAPTVAWQASNGIPYMTSPLLSKGKLHILSDSGIYRCYDPATGRVLNERRAVGAVRASMVANDKHIYITEESGRTTVIENNEHWRVVAENDLLEQVVASPAVSDGSLFIRTDRNLYRLGHHIDTALLK